MFDEERFLELPNQSRIAWSARPVWDRKPPMGGRRNRPAHLDIVGRHHIHRVSNHGDFSSHHSLALSKSNVAIMQKRRGTR